MKSVTPTESKGIRQASWATSEIPFIFIAFDVSIYGDSKQIRG